MARSNFQFFQRNDVDLQGAYAHSNSNWVGGDVLGTSIAYTVGDIVFHDGHLYIAVRDNDNVTPGTSAADWRILTDTDSLVEPIEIPADPDTADPLATVRLERGNLVGSTGAQDFIVFTSFTDSESMPVPVPGFVYRLRGMIGNTPIDGTFLGTDITLFSEVPAMANVMSWRVLHSALVDLPGGDPLPAVRTTVGITPITNPSLFVVGYQTPPADVPEGAFRTVRFTEGDNPVVTEDISVAVGETIFYDDPATNGPGRAYTNISTTPNSISSGTTPATVTTELDRTTLYRREFRGAGAINNWNATTQYAAGDAVYYEPAADRQLNLTGSIWIVPLGRTPTLGTAPNIGLDWFPSNILQYPAADVPPGTFTGNNLGLPSIFRVIGNSAPADGLPTSPRTGTQIVATNGTRIEDADSGIIYAYTAIGGIPGWRATIGANVRVGHGLSIDQDRYFSIDPGNVTTRWVPDRTYHPADHVSVLLGGTIEREYIVDFNTSNTNVTNVFPLSRTEINNTAITPIFSSAGAAYPDYSVVTNGGGLWFANPSEGLIRRPISSTANVTPAPTGTGWTQIGVGSPQVNNPASNSRTWSQVTGRQTLLIEEGGRGVSTDINTLNFDDGDFTLRARGNTLDITTVNPFNGYTSVNTPNEERNTPRFEQGMTNSSTWTNIATPPANAVPGPGQFFFQRAGGNTVLRINPIDSTGNRATGLGDVEVGDSFEFEGANGRTIDIEVVTGADTSVTNDYSFTFTGTTAIQDTDYVVDGLHNIGYGTPVNQVNWVEPTLDSNHDVPVPTNDDANSVLRVQSVTADGPTYAWTPTTDENLLTREIQEITATGTVSNTQVASGNQIIRIQIPTPNYVAVGSAQAYTEFRFNNSPLQIAGHTSQGTRLEFRSVNAANFFNNQVVNVADGYPVVVSPFEFDFVGSTTGNLPMITGRDPTNPNVFLGTDLNNFFWAGTQSNPATFPIFYRSSQLRTPTYSISLDTGTAPLTGNVPIGTNTEGVFTILRNALSESNLYPNYDFTLPFLDTEFRISTGATADVTPTLTYTDATASASIQDVADNVSTSSFSFVSPEGVTVSFAATFGETLDSVLTRALAMLGAETRVTDNWQVIRDGNTLRFANRSKSGVSNSWSASATHVSSVHPQTQGDIAFNAVVEISDGGNTINGFGTGLSINNEGIVTVDNNIGPPDTPTGLTAAMQDFQRNLELSEAGTAPAATAPWQTYSANPYQATLSRQVAAYWDENRATFGTGNYWQDLTAGGAVTVSDGAPSRYYPNPNNPTNIYFPGAESYYAFIPVTMRNASGSNRITSDFRKVILFDVDPNYSQRGTHDLLSFGANVPVLQFNHVSDGNLTGEGLTVRVGIGGGAQRTSTVRTPLETATGLIFEQFHVGTSTEAFVIPASVTTDTTYQISFDVSSTGIELGTATATYRVTNPGSSQTNSNVTVTVPNLSPQTFVANYDSATRQIRLTTTVGNNETWTVGMTYVRTVTWRTSTVFRDFPVNDTSHLGDPNQLSSIALAFEPTNLGDTSTDPELSMKLVVNGTFKDTYPLGVPASHFDFQTIEIGNSNVAVSRMQVYGYTGNDGVTQRDLLAMWRTRGIWLNAFEAPNTREQHYTLNRLMQFRGPIDGPGSPEITARIVEGNAAGTYIWEFSGDPRFGAAAQQYEFDSAEALATTGADVLLPLASRVGQSAVASGVEYRMLARYG